MVTRSFDMRREERVAMREGKGAVGITHLVEPGSRKGVRFFAELSLPPGASIGEHRHDGETEYFLVVDGEGLARDDGREERLFPGDVLITGDGESHSVENVGASNLVMLAVIVTDPQHGA